MAKEDGSNIPKHIKERAINLIIDKVSDPSWNSPGLCSTASNTFLEDDMLSSYYHHLVNWFSDELPPYLSAVKCAEWKKYTTETYLNIRNFCWIPRDIPPRLAFLRKLLKKLKMPSKYPSEFRRYVPKRPRILAQSSIIKRLKAAGKYNTEHIKSLREDSYLISQREFSRHKECFCDDFDEYSITYKGAEKLRDKLDDMLLSILILDPEENKIYTERKRVRELQEYMIETEARWEQHTDRIQTLLTVMFREHKFTSKQLESFSVKDIKITYDANEYISIGMHTSTWTYYIIGEITIDGETFKTKTSYDSETNRV